MLELRYIAMAVCIILPIVLAFYHGIDKARKPYWKWITFIVVTSALILTLLPPIAGSFKDARTTAGLDDFKDVDVYMKIVPGSAEFIDSLNRWEFKANSLRIFTFSDEENTHENTFNVIYKSKEFPEELKSDENLIVTVEYLIDDGIYQAKEIKSVDPLLEYPYIAALKHRIKNLNLHVPLHWVSVIAYLVSLIFSIKFLRHSDFKNDTIASSAIFTGLLFTILGTITGMVWAKFNWGAYWNWDPRQTTILVIMLIYFAYFGLRSSIDDKNKRAKLSAVYSIFAFTSVPVLMFIIPRLLPSLHPGGKDDGTTGPVVSTQADMVDSSLAFTFYLSIAGFLLLYFWILSISARYNNIKNETGVDNV